MGKIWIQQAKFFNSLTHPMKMVQILSFTNTFKEKRKMAKNSNSTPLKALQNPWITWHTFLITTSPINFPKNSLKEHFHQKSILIEKEKSINQINDDVENHNYEKKIFLLIIVNLLNQRILKEFIENDVFLTFFSLLFGLLNFKYPIMWMFYCIFN